MSDLESLSTAEQNKIDPDLQMWFRRDLSAEALRLAVAEPAEDEAAGEPSEERVRVGVEFANAVPDDRMPDYERIGLEPEAEAEFRDYLWGQVTRDVLIELARDPEVTRIDPVRIVTKSGSGPHETGEL